MQSDFTPAQKFLWVEFSKADEARQRWLKGTRGLSSGAVLIIASAIPLFSLLATFEKLGDRLLVLLFYGLLMAGIVVGVNRGSAREAAIRRHLMDSYEQHIRRVLLDQGLLSMVLLTDPIAEFPSLPGAMNILGIPTARYYYDAKSIEQRFQLIIQHYGLLCEQFRLEPLPQCNINEDAEINTPNPARFARMVVAIVLFETLHNVQQQSDTTRTTIVEVPKS